MPEAHRRAADLLNAHVEPALRVSTLSMTRSAVLWAAGKSGKEYVVKLYWRRPPAGPIVNSFESVAYQRLAGKPGVRQCFSSGDGFVITEFIPGNVLKAAARSEGFDYARAGSQLADYINACSAVPGRGFGSPDESLQGEAASWNGYLHRYLRRLKQRLDCLPHGAAPSLQTTFVALQHYLTSGDDRFAGTPSVLVPADLNLANLLMTDQGRLFVLDLKTFLLADPLFAFGEWLANTCGTPIFGAALAAWLTAPGPRQAFSSHNLRFYALLATLDIQLFVAEAGSDPEATCPWGNDACLGELADVHLRALDGPPETPHSLASWSPRRTL